MDAAAARDLLRAANRRHRSGDLQGAVALYREMLSHDPRNRPALWNLSVSLKALGDMPGAIAQCRRLVEAAPDGKEVRFQLAHLLREAGQIEEAVAGYGAILRQSPGNERALVGLNETLRMLRRPSREGRRRICIYSAVFGDYDQIHDPAPQNLDCDYILFTDRYGIGPPPKVWKVVVLDTGRLFLMHPRVNAKYFRMMAHEVFPLLSRLNHNAGLHDYDQVIWVDGSVRITSPDFAGFMIGHIRKHGLAMLKHPRRRCIYREAVVSAPLRKYRHQRILEQAEHYRQEGYPENNGLMATTIIARDMRRRELDAVFADWWEENLKWTYQDQISLPYVLWKHGRWYDEIEASLSRNPYFAWEVFNRKPTSRVT